MPKFSIIVPVYNVAPYLRECLDSVLAQTFADWECLCVDDGSTDESGVILDEYAAKDSRFRVFHKENGGVSSARNLALDNVQGEYVAFVDGDDWILPDWFETIASLISETPGVDWVRLENRDWGNGAYTFKDDTTLRKEIVQGDDILPFGWKQVSRNAVPFVNVYRRVILDASRFDTSLSMREDAIFALSLLPFIQTCVHYNYDGYVYRILNTSATRRKKSVAATLNFEKALLDVWKQHKECVRWSVQHKMSECYTLLTHKDVMQWYSVRDRDSREDEKALQKICWAAWKSGAISFSLKQWKRDVRFVCFMLTGCIKCLMFSFNNLLKR